MNLERVIQPPERPEIPPNEPAIFLNGPIQGTSDWQEEAIKIIHWGNPQIWIFNPRRDQPFATGDQKEYGLQVHWEIYFRDLISHKKTGINLFWLAKERYHDSTRAYAQTTRVETGISVMERKYSGAKIILGVEDGYTGARYLREVIKHYCPEVIVHDNLMATCNEALKLLKS